MNFNIITEVNQVDHIKPFEVQVRLDITNEKMMNILKSISELNESERFVLVYWEIKSPLFPTKFMFNVEELSRTVQHPGKWCTSYAEFTYILENGINIKVKNQKQANRVELNLKHSLLSFLKKIEKKYYITN